MNTPAPFSDAEVAQERVLGWQTKLHRWAGEDERVRFGDLFNLLCDPATLLVAWERVKRNRGSKTAGVDGETRKRIEQLGVEKVLGELRQSLRDGTYAPLPVRERKIPKRGSGKVRRLGIPTVIAYPEVAQAGFGFVGCHASVSSAVRRAVGGVVRSPCRRLSFVCVRGRAAGERVAAGGCD